MLSSSTAGLLALAAALAVWEVSGIIRASIGALDEIYETPEESAMVGPLPALVRTRGPRPGRDARRDRLRWPVAIALVAVAFQLIVHWAPAKHRPYRWASFGSALVVGWIGETLIFGWYVRSFADFRTPVGSLEMFIFLATYFYVAAIVLLVAMQELLPLVTGVIRG